MTSLTSRRRFLQGATAAVAFPTIIPSSVRGQNPPSSRIQLGVIGTGGKAMGGARNFQSGTTAQITALADPNRPNMQPFRDAFQVPEERCYSDFNELLALKDIDAVLVGTPDHWHVPVSIAAAKAGKHVYCEKPMSVSIAEGQALVKAIQESGVVFQHGTQLRSQALHAHRVRIGPQRLFWQRPQGDHRLAARPGHRSAGPAAGATHAGLENVGRPRHPGGIPRRDRR